MSKQFLYQNENVSDSFPLCGRRSFVVRYCKFVLIIHHRELIYFVSKSNYLILLLILIITGIITIWTKIIEIVLIAEHIFCSMNSVKINKC